MCLCSVLSLFDLVSLWVTVVAAIVVPLLRGCGCCLLVWFRFGVVGFGCCVLIAVVTGG